GQEKYLPPRPVKIVERFEAGDNDDIIRLIITGGLGVKKKSHFDVVNKGAGTVYSGAVEEMESLAVGNVHRKTGVGGQGGGTAIKPNIKYDPIKDFSHIAMLGGEASVLVVHPSLGVKTIGELVEKAKKEQLVWAASSFGALAHLAGEYFQQLAGIKMRHVPYK